MTVSLLLLHVVLPAVLIILVEALKMVAVVRAFRRSDDGNVMGLTLALEGATFAVDAAIVCLAVFPYDDFRAVALFTVCAVFLIARLVSSLTLSRILRK